MFGSILLTIYFLFLLAFCGLMGFALYRVMIFSESKELAGKARYVAFAVAVVSVMVIIATFFSMSYYDWDDGFKAWRDATIVSSASSVGLEEKKEVKTKEKKIEVVKKEVKKADNTEEPVSSWWLPNIKIRLPGEVQKVK